MNVALSELPHLSCRTGRAPQPHHSAGILIAPSLAYLDQAYLDARTLGAARAPVIEVMIPSTQDSTLAPRGAHVASLFCQHFPRHRSDGRKWADAKQAAIDSIVDTVTAYAPNFRAAILGVQALSPEDLEQRFGLVGGDIFHGQMTLDQLYWSRPAVGYANYRSPLPGVYFVRRGRTSRRRCQWRAWPQCRRSHARRPALRSPVGRRPGLLGHGDCDPAGHDRRIMWRMQRVAEYELQRVLSRRQLDFGFGLTESEMPDRIGCGQRHIKSRHLRDIDKQMVMASIGQINARRSNPDAAQAEAHGDR
jgi:hypothetical protein